MPPFPNPTLLSSTSPSNKEDSRLRILAPQALTAILPFTFAAHLRTLVSMESLCTRGKLKCDGMRTETRFRLSAKRTSPFKSAGASVQWTTGSRGVRISGSNAGYTMFRGSVKGTGYPLHSPIFPSLPLPCVTECRNISTGFYAEGVVILSDVESHNK